MGSELKGPAFPAPERLPAHRRRTCHGPQTPIRAQVARRRAVTLTTLFALLLLLTGAAPAQAQQAAASPVAAQSATLPWDLGVFADGGSGVSDRSDYKFFWLGAHAGKFLTAPSGPSLIRGQFEYAVEFMPLWQAYTPRYPRVNCAEGDNEELHCSGAFETGGTYSGLSITPIILRWNIVRFHRWMPWIQGAGGLVWTNHKFPPTVPVPDPGHLGTSVFNFTPQFGVGVHYFVRRNQSISLSANAVHISSASLGDANPGVNASVQFTIGYTWWR